MASTIDNRGQLLGRAGATHRASSITAPRTANVVSRWLIEDKSGVLRPDCASRRANRMPHAVPSTFTDTSKADLKRSKCQICMISMSF
jgi:hypothetical protein